MNHFRPASLLLVGGLFVSFVVPSCKTGDDDTTAEECSRGAKGCRCKSNDTCNSGLSCNDDGKCVGAAAQGGSAGAGGTSGQANGGRAGTESFARAGSQGHGTGGTAAEAGAAGDPGTGGLVGRGTGGSGNATGQAGDGAAAGESGAPGSGGAGGTGGTGTGGTGGSNAAGTGGTAGGGGSAPCTAITTTSLQIHLSTGNATYSSAFTPSQGPDGDDDLVALQLYDGVILETNYHGAGLGTFELGTGEDANYATCSRCVVAGINGSEKWFLATEGTLTFELDSKQINASPHGTLRNVVLREAAYDDGTFVSTFVPGGACLTLANGDLLVNSDEPAWTCEPDFYDDDGDFCDCGCGGHDPDCASSNLSVCEYCYCNPNDDMDCSAVDSIQNRSCGL